MYISSLGLIILFKVIFYIHENFTTYLYKSFFFLGRISN